MTLRVTLSIVPHGIEEDIYDIHTINISNLGIYEGEYCYKYGVEVDKYKTQEYDHYVFHSRKDGALQLVMQALEKVLRDG